MNKSIEDIVADRIGDKPRLVFKIVAIRRGKVLIEPWIDGENVMLRNDEKMPSRWFKAGEEFEVHDANIKVSII